MSETVSLPFLKENKHTQDAHTQRRTYTQHAKKGSKARRVIEDKDVVRPNKPPFETQDLS